MKEHKSNDNLFTRFSGPGDFKFVLFCSACFYLAAAEDNLSTLRSEWTEIWEACRYT